MDELDIALKTASEQSNSSGQRSMQNFVGLLGQIPGLGGGFADQARSLQAVSVAQQSENDRMRASAPQTAQAGPGIPGLSPDMDPVKVAAKIYPILEFRDHIVKAINATIAKIPGLEALVEKISETLTLFILSLLAPFVRPIINKVSESLKTGSSGVISASQDQQFGPWNDPHCTDPTHSMLSKDHFSNILNACAGRVAATILQYVVPRVLYAWEHPGVPVEEVMQDIIRVFHHPAIRDESLEIHRNMFNTVRKWVDENPERNNLNNTLCSSSVKAGRNHKLNISEKDSHNLFRGLGEDTESEGPVWQKIISRDLGEMSGGDGNSAINYLSSSPRAGSPASSSQLPDFGYNSSPFPPQEPLMSPNLRPDGLQAFGSYQQVPTSLYNQPVPYGDPYQQSPPGGMWPQSGPGYQGTPGYSSGPPPMGQPYGAPQYPGPGYPGQPYGAQSYSTQYGGPPNQYQ